MPEVTSPVECVVRLLTALGVTLEGLLLGVGAYVDFQAVGGEEGLVTALLVAHKGVLASVPLLVGAQVPRRAVGPRTALEHALVAFHLSEQAGSRRLHKLSQNN